MYNGYYPFKHLTEEARDNELRASFLIFLSDECIRSGLFLRWEAVLYSYPTKLQSDIPLPPPPVSHSRVTLRKHLAINLSLFRLNTKGLRQLFDICLKLQSVLMSFPLYILSKIESSIHY